MIIHICDCCKREIESNMTLNCSIPIEEYTEARDSAGQIIAKYKMGMCSSKDVELCPICANKLASLFSQMKRSSYISK